jgi:centromere protein J
MEEPLPGRSSYPVPSPTEGYLGEGGGVGEETSWREERESKSTSQEKVDVHEHSFEGNATKSFDPYWPPSAAGTAEARDVIDGREWRMRLFHTDSEEEDREAGGWDQEGGQCEDQASFLCSGSEMAAWQARHREEMTEFESLERALAGFPAISLQDGPEPWAAKGAQGMGWTVAVDQEGRPAIVGEEEDEVDEEDEEDEEDEMEPGHVGENLTADRGREDGKQRGKYQGNRTKSHSNQRFCEGNVGLPPSHPSFPSSLDTCLSCGSRRGSLLLRALENKQEVIERELARAEKETKAAEKQRRRSEAMLAEARNRKEQVEAWAVTERAAIEKWREDQRELVGKEKKAFLREQAEARRYLEVQRALPTREERVEREALLATIEKMKLDAEGQRKRWAANSKRQAALIQEQQARLEELQRQVESAKTGAASPGLRSGIGPRGQNASSMSAARQPRDSPLPTSPLSTGHTGARPLSHPTSASPLRLEKRALGAGHSIGVPPCSFLSRQGDGKAGAEEGTNAVQEGSSPGYPTSPRPHGVREYTVTPPSSTQSIIGRTSDLSWGGARTSPSAAIISERPPPFAPPYHHLHQGQVLFRRERPLPVAKQDSQPASAAEDSSSSVLTSEKKAKQPAASGKGGGGKTIRKLPDGREEWHYSNGTVKEVHPNGKSIVHFMNGDIKTVEAGTGDVVYWYAANQTKHTTVAASGLEIFEFPSGQVERHYPNGVREIQVPGMGVINV